jgi:hypothetical protein
MFTAQLKKHIYMTYQSDYYREIHKNFAHQIEDLLYCDQKRNSLLHSGAAVDVSTCSSIPTVRYHGGKESNGYQADMIQNRQVLLSMANAGTADNKGNWVVKYC